MKNYLSLNVNSAKVENLDLKGVLTMKQIPHCRKDLNKLLWFGSVSIEPFVFSITTKVQVLIKWSCIQYLVLRS